MLVTLLISLAVANVAIGNKISYDYIYSSDSEGWFEDECNPADIKPVENFDFDKYLGVWYEIERYPNKYEYFTSCVVSDYKPTAQTDEGVEFDIDMKFKWMVFNQEASLTGLYIKGDTKGEFIMVPEHNKKPNSFVVKTDYETYSVNYGCDKNIFGQYVEQAWINARENTLPAETIQEIKDFLTDMGSDVSKFEEPQHVDC